MGRDKRVQSLKHQDKEVHVSCARGSGEPLKVLKHESGLIRVIYLLPTGKEEPIYSRERLRMSFLESKPLQDGYGAPFTSYLSYIFMFILTNFHQAPVKYFEEEVPFSTSLEGTLWTGTGIPRHPVLHAPPY